MSDNKKPLPVTYRGDLRKVYLDPLVGPRDMLAWIPEQHASAKCERALRGGNPEARPDRDAPWCDMCVTTDKAAAIVRPHAGPWKRRAA
jgi:hypothetical protein